MTRRHRKACTCVSRKCLLNEGKGERLEFEMEMTGKCNSRLRSARFDFYDTHLKPGET